MRRPSAVNIAQATGLVVTTASVGAIYWPAGGILLGLALAALGYIHDRGDQ